MKQLLMLLLAVIPAMPSITQEVTIDHVNPVTKQRTIRLAETMIAGDGSTVSVDCIIDLYQKTDTFYFLNFYIKDPGTFKNEHATDVIMQLGDGSTLLYPNIAGMYNCDNETLPGEIAAICSPTYQQFKKIMKSRIVKVTLQSGDEKLELPIPHPYRKVLAGMTHTIYHYLTL